MAMYVRYLLVAGHHAEVCVSREAEGFAAILSVLDPAGRVLATFRVLHHDAHVADEGARLAAEESLLKTPIPAAQAAPDVKVPPEGPVGPPVRS